MNNRLFPFYKTASGFTLVELAIVLMIIGLLIGGVLRGQELLQNARIKSTVQQVNSYQAAVTTFQDAYGAMPGDFALAFQRLPGCITANHCVSGNGDGLIGEVQTDVIPKGNVSENYQFWKHMALTHLISGVDPSADPASPEAGKTNPVSKFNGVFGVTYDKSFGAGAYASYEGLFLLMMTSNMIQAGEDTAGNVEGKWTISPKNAAQIDRMMDDGIPGTGSVLSVDAGYAPISGRCEAPFPYDETSDRLNCILMFKIK